MSTFWVVVGIVQMRKESVENFVWDVRSKLFLLNHLLAVMQCKCRLLYASVIFPSLLVMLCQGSCVTAQWGLYPLGHDGRCIVYWSADRVGSTGPLCCIQHASYSHLMHSDWYQVLHRLPVSTRQPCQGLISLHSVICLSPPLCSDTYRVGRKK